MKNNIKTKVNDFSPSLNSQECSQTNNIFIRQKTLSSHRSHLFCFEVKLNDFSLQDNRSKRLSDIKNELVTTQIQQFPQSKLKARNILISQGIVDQSNQKVNDDQIGQICEEIYSLGIKKNLEANNISPVGIASFPAFNFDNITHLSLGENKIGNLGCMYISRTSLKKCRQLSLPYNQIGRAGILHLSKAQWNFIQSIQLTGNILSVNSIQHMVKANWKTLLQLYLSLSELTFAETLHLLQMQMPIKLLEMNGYQAEKHEKEKLKRFMKQKDPRCNTYLLE